MKGPQIELVFIKRQIQTCFLIFPGPGNSLEREGPVKDLRFEKFSN